MINEMRRNDVMRIFHELDIAKHQLSGEGYSFDFRIVFPGGHYLHTGIGTPAQMTMLVLIQMAEIYKRIAIIEEKEVPLEVFAEMIKRRLIEFLDDKTISFGEEETHETHNADAT